MAEERNAFIETPHIATYFMLFKPPRHSLCTARIIILRNFSTYQPDQGIVDLDSHDRRLLGVLADHLELLLVLDQHDVRLQPDVEPLLAPRDGLLSSPTVAHN